MRSSTATWRGSAHPRTATSAGADGAAQAGLPASGTLPGEGSGPSPADPGSVGGDLHDDLAGRVALGAEPEGVGELGEREGAGHRHGQLTPLDEPGQVRQVVPV